MSVSRLRPLVVADISGQVLDYVEITSNVSVTGSEGAETTVITGNPVTYDGETEVEIEFFSPTLLPAASASAAVRLYLFDGGTNLGRLGDTTTPSATAERVGPVVGRRILTPSVGSHTYSVKAATTTGTATVGAGAGGLASAFLPAYMQIKRRSTVIGAAGVAGVQGGFAPLDSGLLVPTSYLPGYGAWSNWTPVLTADSGDPTLGSGSSSLGRYIKQGKTVHGWGRITFGSSGASAGSGQYELSIPEGPMQNSTAPVLGTALLYDASAALFRVGVVYNLDTSEVRIAYDNSTNLVASSTAPWTWTVNDAIFWDFRYELA